MPHIPRKRNLTPQLCAHVVRSSDHESTSNMVDGFCVLDSRYVLLNTITRDAPTEFTEVHRLMQDRDTLPALITQIMSIFAGEGHTSGFEVLKIAHKRQCIIDRDSEACECVCSQSRMFQSGSVPRASLQNSTYCHFDCMLHPFAS